MVYSHSLPLALVLVVVLMPIWGKSQMHGWKEKKWSHHHTKLISCFTHPSLCLYIAALAHTLHLYMTCFIQLVLAERSGGIFLGTKKSGNTYTIMNQGFYIFQSKSLLSLLRLDLKSTQENQSWTVRCKCMMQFMQAFILGLWLLGHGIFKSLTVVSDIGLSQLVNSNTLWSRQQGRDYLNIDEWMSLI